VARRGQEGFLSKFCDLEKALAEGKARQREESPAPAAESDQKTEKVIERIEKMLQEKEWEKEA
jgi:hypothetical protein